MERRETILNELKATSKFLDKGIDMPFVVSEAYFKNLSMDILKDIEKGEHVPNKNIEFPNYSIPNNYFSNLSNSILENIQNKEVSDELSSFAPTLNSIAKKAPYQVPDNYFNDFTLNTKVQTTTYSSETKVVSIVNKKWYQIAIAASIIGFIATLGYFIFEKSSSINASYASYKSVDVQGSVQKVSDDDLEKYLNNNDVVTSSTDLIIGDDAEEVNPKQEIKTVSDNELKQYLKEVGESKKNVKKRI